MKLPKINQKDLRSNIVPNKDTCELGENKAENKVAKTIPNPDTKSADFGKITLPSINRAMTQKIMEKANPNTKSNPFPVSIGILVKGKQKTGNKTTTKNNDKNESRSNIFVFIVLLYYIFIKKTYLAFNSSFSTRNFSLL